MRRFSTAVTITDPLVKYQTLVRSGVYCPDPSQHRLARQLRKVYERIKDYSPQAEYRQRLNQIADLTKTKIASEDDEEEPGKILALRNHSIWRNPLFKHLAPSREDRDSLALTRILSNHETAMEIDSPKGLFLSGEVGTGKSMLLDLLADGLPTKRKRRWHFNTFMLYIFAQLDKHRKSHRGNLGAEMEFSLAWMAKKLVDESPILFLDEFQLPDRAASKILSHLFIAFFQLGGVLVASSNRMPEELQKASGIDYAPSPAKGLLGKLFGGSMRCQGELYGQSSDFANFLDVLKARCEFWQMEGSIDWRRRAGNVALGPALEAIETDDVAVINAVDAESSEPRRVPQEYHLTDVDGATFEQAIANATGYNNSAGLVPWQPSSLIVYGRPVMIRQQYKGTVFWRFDELVANFGPADYITLASSYHTFIIDEVPVLTVLQKNEARRFITFLDALYEARCKLVVRAKQPPDDLFFPVKKKAGPSASSGDGHDDATYSETVAEVYQDQTSPFRPNVSLYDAPAKYDPDQDSDFGLQQKNMVDFGNTNAFTGEDEKFAYKRAVSRLWELCSASWHARTGDWWQPLPSDARHWEGKCARPPIPTRTTTPAGPHAESMGESIETEVAGLAKLRVDQFRSQ